MGRVDEVMELDEVVELRERIDRWRETRKPGRAMPAELWSAAASLAVRHGVYAVARAVRVHYGALRSLADEVEAEQPAVSGFVEVGAVPPAVGPSPPAVRELELTGADGAALVMRFAEGSTVDVPGLAAAFWSRGA